MAYDNPLVHAIFVLVVAACTLSLAWLCAFIHIASSEPRRRQFERQVPDSHQYLFEPSMADASQRKQGERQLALHQWPVRRDGVGLHSVSKNRDVPRCFRCVGGGSHYNKIRWLEERRLLWENKRLTGVSCEYPGAYSNVASCR
jgi:hypothetical protein